VDVSPISEKKEVGSLNDGNVGYEIITPRRSEKISENLEKFARVDYAKYENNDDLKSDNDLSRLYLVPRGSDSKVLDGIIFIKSGVYQGAKFKFMIKLSTHYSILPPLVTFKSRVYHPLVDYNTGELDMNFLTPHWGKDVKLENVVDWVKAIFHEEEYLGITNSVNKDAGVLFHERLRAFDEYARKTVDESNSLLYENNPQESLKFKELNAIHKKILTSLAEIVHNSDISQKDKVRLFMDKVVKNR